jgi:hypothetical protein
MRVVQTPVIVFTLMVAGTNVFGQKNLLDVPSSEIVEPKKLFFQQQAVFTKSEINTACIFTYGLGNDFEIGVTFYQIVFKRSVGLTIDPETAEENPDFLINAQKRFNVNERLKLGIGTRSGINAARSDQVLHFVNFNYVNAHLSLGQGDNTIIAGLWYANDAYAGSGTNWGLMGGAEVNVIDDRVDVVADFISGNCPISVINAGFNFKLPKEWAVTLGVQFPFPESGNDNGFVFQVSKN